MTENVSRSHSADMPDKRDRLPAGQPTLGGISRCHGLGAQDEDIDPGIEAQARPVARSRQTGLADWGHPQEGKTNISKAEEGSRRDGRVPQLESGSRQSIDTPERAVCVTLAGSLDNALRHFYV